MATHQFKFDTLRKCFEFLKLLDFDSEMRDLVASELHKVMNNYYNDIQTNKLKLEFSDFLKKVVAFHSKLVNPHVYSMALGRANSLYTEIEEPQQIIVALLQCIPKFLAAMYFLRYKVGMEFVQLGGGGWANDMVGWGGGDLYKYLHEQLKKPYYGDIIPGGFGPLEVRYIGGYQWGHDMVKDLDNILSKQNHNFVRDVLATSVFSNNVGAEIPNTANVLALVRSLCLIVDGEDRKDNGRELIKYLNEDLSIHLKSSDKSIYWQYLKEHCAELKSQIHKLFSSEAFSYTGQSMEPRYVQTKEFAKETAKWLRNNLEEVKKNLQNISTGYTDTYGNFNKLGEYFTKNLFPYGFIFGFEPGQAYNKGASTLIQTWRDAIDKIKVKAEGLEKLEKILNGELPPPSPKPAPPHSTQNEATNYLVASAQGVQIQHKKYEGVQNQGKKSEGTPHGGDGQSRDTSPAEQIPDSALASTASANGNADPAEPKGDKGAPSPTNPELSDSLPTQHQRIVQPPHQAFSFSPLADTATTGQALEGDFKSTQDAASPPLTVKTQTPSVTGSLSQPSGTSSPDGDQGVLQHNQKNELRSTTTSDTAATETPPGRGAAPGKGGNAAKGTNVESQGNLISNQSPAQHITTSDSIAAPTSSVADNSLVSPGRTLQSSPRDNSHDRAAGRTKHSTTTISQDRALGSAGGADGAASRDTQNAANQGNEPQGQLGPTLPVPPAAPPITPPDTEQSPNTPRGSVVSQGVHDQKALQTLHTSSTDDRDSTGHMGHQAATSSTEQHGMASKVVHMAPGLTAGTSTTSPPITLKVDVITADQRVSTSNSPPSKDTPSPQTENLDDLQIYVRKPTVTEQTFDYDIGYEFPSLHDSALSDRIVPSLPSITFDLSRPETKLSPPSDTKQSSPSKDDPKFTKVEIVDKCVPLWITIPNVNVDDIPEIALFPAEAPRTIRDMLRWLVGIGSRKHLTTLEKCINSALGKVLDVVPGNPTLCVNNSKLKREDLIKTVKLASIFSSSVLSAIEPDWKQKSSKSGTVKRMDTDQDQDPDGCALLCRLQDYVYACYHQLAFLRSQCAGDKFRGGWMGCQFGRDVTADSPLQAFLTDAYYSRFNTHLFDPCDVCLKSRIRMGFRKGDFSKSAKDGSYLYYLLSPSCSGDDDPLMTLSSYLNCLTRRTPRTTGELVSFFQHFGSEMRKDVIGILSDMGTALSTPHPECPEWDHLRRHDLDAVRGIRVSESPVSKHDNDHAGTLSTLVGCDITNVQCTKLLSPITHRAYAMSSPCFVHTYLSWVVYLADTLRESLDRLRYDFTRHEFSKCGSIHHCQDALPYLYFHGFTPPEGTSTSLVKCSQVIAKLEEVVNGGPIAKLINCMDQFLYRVRGPFIYTIIALWSTAFLLFAHTALYRLDMLRIQSHLMRSRGSHVIDVKALLTDGTKMPSLYDIDYFDDEALAHAWNRIY